MPDASIPVMADAQFGSGKLLRPSLNYDSIYTIGAGAGTALLDPIMFTEGGVVLDPNAGKPGYDLRLLKGLSVPMGARMILWLPIIRPKSVPPYGPYYIWRVMWRMRNLYDFRANRIPYHIPRQAPGVPDTTVDDPGARVLLIAANHSTIYAPSHPIWTTSGYPAIHDLVIETIRPSNANTAGLGIPWVAAPPTNVRGKIAQGAADAAVSSIYSMTPLYQPYEIPVMGDELLLGVYRDTGTPTDKWNFTTTDLAFKTFFDNQELGVYVFVGSAP